MIELKLFQLLLNERFFFRSQTTRASAQLNFSQLRRINEFFSFLTALFVTSHRENSTTQTDGKRVPDRYKGRAPKKGGKFERISRFQTLMTNSTHTLYCSKKVSWKIYCGFKKPLQRLFKNFPVMFY